MTKQLSIAAALVLAAACKTDPQPAAAPPAADQPTTSARSAKIDIKPVLPSQPATRPDDSTGDDRQERRNRRRAQMDTNGDGVVSDEERAAAMRDRMGYLRSKLDLNGDGKLTPDELAGAEGRMHFDDPAALDTNHDGDISADELAAGLKARRDAIRAQRALPNGEGSAAATGSGN